MNIIINEKLAQASNFQVPSQQKQRSLRRHSRRNFKCRALSPPSSPLSPDTFHVIIAKVNNSTNKPLFDSFSAFQLSFVSPLGYTQIRFSYLHLFPCSGGDGSAVHPLRQCAVLQDALLARLHVRSHGDTRLLRYSHEIHPPVRRRRPARPLFRGQGRRPCPRLGARYRQSSGESSIAYAT